ncbi:hypothetical protein LDENG_00180030, partial [Lucifuga dentata]
RRVSCKTVASGQAGWNSCWLWQERWLGWETFGGSHICAGKNGGGAFLVPYVLFLLCCGIPMFLLETAVGQYTSQGCITCWRYFCPLFEGVGYATQVVIAYAAVSYIVIQAWAFFYLFYSFSAEVPWASCRNTWNTGRLIMYFTE